MEDFSHLGICNMEERAWLTDLVQLLEVFDLDMLGSGDDDSCNGNDAATQDVANYAVVTQKFNYSGSTNPDSTTTDNENEAPSPLSSIRRKLYFNTDNDCQKKQSSENSDQFNISAEHTERAPAMPLQIHHGSPMEYNGNSNMFEPGNHSFPSDYHNFSPGITRYISMHSTDDTLSSRCPSFQNPKVCSPPGSSRIFKNKTCGPQNRKGISRKQNLYPDLRSSGSFGCMPKPIPVYKAKRAVNYNYGLPLNPPVTPNKRRVGKHRIMVCVRKRPLTKAENKRQETDVVTTPSGESVVVHESKDAVDLSQYILEHRFYFNHVFGERSSNEDVYQISAYPLVQHMLNGGSSTCFAYGQTGAGKTHTMLGSHPGNPGLYALAVRDIFMHISATPTHSSLQVFVSFFEIYCGQLYDLLDQRKRLFARENEQKVVQICGLRHVRVDSVNSLLQVVSHGTETRTQGISGVNPCSSRSHALLQIQLRNSNQQIAGRMWFVDLAGSERASDTKEPDKQSRMEGAEINRSLLALKECIRALDREHTHTPFRQSKLTQVLKTAFIGDSMTCMIANISPGHRATEHTLNTLRYADRVKELKENGGQQEKRGSKAMLFPKHSLPNNCSRGNVGTRGKGVSKKPHLGREKADFGSNPPTTRSYQSDIICSVTPTKSSSGKESNLYDTKEIGQQSMRMLLDMHKKRNRSFGCGEKKSRRTENRRYGNHLRQQIDEQLDLWMLQKQRGAYQDHLSIAKRQSEVDHREKGTQQFTVKDRSGEDRKWMEPKEEVQSSQDTNSQVEKSPERNVEDVDVSNEERKIHLRRYHKQLQKFVPSANSSVHVQSPNTPTSLRASVSSSILDDFSSHPVSTNRFNGMEEYIDTYIANGGVIETNSEQLPEAHLQGEKSGVHHSNHDVNTNDGAVEDFWVFQRQHGKVRCGQLRAESHKRLDRTAGDRRVRKRSTRTKHQQRRLARVATQEADLVNLMTTNVKVQMSSAYDFQDRNDLSLGTHSSSDCPADGVCITELEGVVLGNSRASCPDFFGPTIDSLSQQAPAERPFSPACEQSNTFSNPIELTDICPQFINTECNSNAIFLLLQNSSETTPLIHYENEPGFAANAKTLFDFSKTPPHYKESETTVLPQNDADSFSCAMDPLDISLHQGFQQSVSTLYLRRAKSDGSLSWIEDEIGEGKIKVVGKDCPTGSEQKQAQQEEEEFPVSFLELPKITSHIMDTSDSTKAATETETSQICRLDKTEPLKVSRGFQKDQENSLKPHMTPTLVSKDPAYPHKDLTCTSPQTPIIEQAVQHVVNAIILTSQAIANAKEMPSASPQTDFKKALPFASTPQPEDISHHFTTAPSQCHTLPSDHDYVPDISFHPDKTSASLSERDSCNQNMLSLDDWNYAKWCVVKAHWEQLKEMEVLFKKEGMLLHRQSDMSFQEYIQRLVEILEEKAKCVNSMQVQLQPYLKYTHHNHFQNPQ